MVPGAVAEWVDASSFRHDPMAQVSASTVREDCLVPRYPATAPPILRLAVRFGAVLELLVVSIFISVRTHQATSFDLY